MKVVVVGAGYAGTIAANRLARKRPDAHVTLVNPRPEFVERIRLHELVAGSGTASRPLTEMVGERVAVRIAAVEKIGDGDVVLDDGGALAFDRLVYAVGGAVEAPQGTVAVGAFESALDGAAAVAALPEGGRVDVVGGGLTGIETASEVASHRPDLRVRLISDTPVGASLGVDARRRVEEVLAGMGVETVREGWREPADDALTLWSVARQVSDLAARSGLRVDADGRVIVDRYLRSVSDPRIVAVGDAAAVPGSRMSCQAAMPQGAYAADSIARELAGKSPKPFSMGFTGQCVSLGRRNAVVQRSHRDDSPARLWLRGATAVFVKEQVCRATVVAARTSRYAWLPGPA